MDISHVWGNDISFTPRGDLTTVSGADQVEQRLYRRLMTNLLGYSWSPGYGGGLPAFVGQPVHADTIRAVIIEQCALEPDVTNVTVSLDVEGTSVLYVAINYVYGPTGADRSLTFGLGG